MTKTLLDIDDQLMADAQAVVGPGTTKVEAVRTALTQMVRKQRQLESIAWMAEKSRFLSDEEIAAERTTRVG